MAVKRTKQGALTERVATMLLGQPTGVDPEKGSVTFGEIAVNLATGRYFDFEDETAGTHVELIQRFMNLQNGQAERWMQENIREADASTLPADGVVERALIGMLASQPELVAAIEEEITADHFAEPVHKQIFGAIMGAEVAAGSSVPLSMLLAACGGDPLMPVQSGFSLIGYLALIIRDAPMAPDMAHLARSLASQMRSQANREGDVDDEYDPDPPPAPFISQFAGIRFEQLDEPGPEYAHVIDELITVGDKSVLGGASLSGKSFLAIHMAMCIATATSFFGRRILTPGLVIYQAGEGGRGIKKRFRAWRQHFGVPNDRVIPVYILQSRVDIHSHEGDTGKLVDEIKGIERMYGMPVVALFIDTLQKAQGMADENSGRDMGTVMANVDRIADAVPGCHVCLVHHMNAGGTKLRGHTSVYAGVDQVILVTKDPETKVRTAILDKQKDDEDGAKINFELMQVEVGRRALDGKPITSCVTLPIGGALELKVQGKSNERTVNLSHQQKNILTALKNALAEHGEPTPATLKLPKSIAVVVDYKWWVLSYKAIASESDDAAVRQAMKRAYEKLYSLKIIGRINPYVWLTGRATVEVEVPFEMGSMSAATSEPTQEEFPEEFAPR